jgi:hypothetical protein
MSISESTTHATIEPRNQERASVARASILVGATAGAVLVLGWLVGWIVFGTPLAFLRPADDAYYYFDVASHLVHGRGLSTDGIHTTNGFHPLWMVMLLPFAAIFDAPSQTWSSPRSF